MYFRSSDKDVGYLSLWFFWCFIPYLCWWPAFYNSYKTSLSNKVYPAATSVSDIRLSLNVDKCEFLSFNKNSSTLLCCCGFTMPLVDSLLRISISLINTLPSIRQCTVSNYNKKIQLGYVKIDTNRGKYNKLVLAKPYSTFCDHLILFAYGIFPLLKKII